MSKQDVETLHSDYAKFKREADLIVAMMDEHETKKQCLNDQGGADSFLKQPLSYTRTDKEKERALYDRYVEHALLPEHIVSDASEEMVGICFRIDPVINLPDKIKYLENHVNGRGDSLLAMTEDVLRDLVATRKACISTDIRDEHSVVDHKKSATMLNWRKNSSGYVMLVFSESYLDEKGVTKEQRRHYSVESGILVVSVYRQKQGSGEWELFIELDDAGNAVPQPSLPKNQPYDYIPIRIAQTVKPALLGMARTVWKGFKLSADYYGMLHTLTPTLVIKSDSSAEKLNVGFENGVKVGKDDKVELLQPGTDGADPLRVAMETQFNSAVDQGIRLVSTSSAAESGEAIYLRNSNKQIKIDSVAREASEQIEEALRVAAILEGANPDEVEFRLEVQLVDEPVDVETLKEMREGVVDSQLIKHEDYLRKLAANDLIHMDTLPDGEYDTAAYIKEVDAQAKKMNTVTEVV